jgi:subtilisin family serine protease
MRRSPRTREASRALPPQCLSPVEDWTPARPRRAAYRAKLSAGYHDTLRAAQIPDSRKVYDYGVTLNGFAARLTPVEATRLATAPGVRRIWKNTIVATKTVSTPDFLGLTGPQGVWAGLGGDTHAGEGVIIGVVDSGLWPEHPSFAALPEPRPDQAVINAKWKGRCDAGDEPSPADRVTCNNKVIGARWFDAAHIDRVPGEFDSPRDFDGHGSLVASIAAGNHGVPATLAGNPVGSASGMAPAARLAIYKAIYRQSNGGTFAADVDLVAAIDQAVADGVDVINYSIDGPTDTQLSPDEIAFFNAASAGVFAAAAAGNLPGDPAVVHPSPWVTTVAAGTHDRGNAKSVTLGNGSTYTGVGAIPPALPSTALVDSANVGLAGTPAPDAELCFSGALEPAKVQGKIVLCKRGVNARTEKSAEVARAGGVGMVLYDDPDLGLIGDIHSVPTVHVNQAAGLAIKAYVASDPEHATASMSATFNPGTPAPAVASFSSAGPAGPSGDLLKPDIMAPGVDIVGAFSSVGGGGPTFNQASGTSTATPHIAGIAALLRQQHPKWSPMVLKSALMTSAAQLDNSGEPIKRGTDSATPFDFGAGEVTPRKSVEPGLVYDSGPEDWERYGCAIGQAIDPARCAQLGTVDASDLNSPSIAVDSLVGSQKVRRTVTNALDHSTTFHVSVSAPPGFQVAVTPPQLRLAAGQSTSYTVTIARTTAPIGAWMNGSLTWSDGAGHEVRSPLVVRQNSLIEVPESLTGTGLSGSVTYTANSGYTGTLTAAAHGLTRSTVTDLRLVGSEPNFNRAAPATGPAVGSVDVTVPAGARLARFATYNADHAAGTDIDLFVYRIGEDGTLSLVGSSTKPAAQESVTLTGSGRYRVFVVQFALPAGMSEQHVLHHHTVVGAEAVSMSVTPGTTEVGLDKPANLTLAWSGLQPGGHYLGVISYSDGTTQFPVNPANGTIIEVTT